MSFVSPFITVLVIFFTPSFVEAGLGCERLDPRQQVDEQIIKDVDGSAQTLFKIGKVGGSLKTETKKAVTNLYDKYSNADKVMLNSQLIYFFCTYLDNANSLTDEQKGEKFNTFMKQIKEVEHPPLKAKPNKSLSRDQDTLAAEQQKSIKDQANIIEDLATKNTSQARTIEEQQAKIKEQENQIAKLTEQASDLQKRQAYLLGVFQTMQRMIEALKK